MKKMFPSWMFAALALALAAPPSFPANAQQSNRPNQFLLTHLAPGAMSAADNATVKARQQDLSEAAKIYGYNIEAGNWSYEQTLCAPMPDTILLHYVRKYPDETESLFTAAVPRVDGRIRIVPVLYRNATPYMPAPKNPRNYALFNNLVPQSIASRDAAANGHWLELSACYAELTGDPTSLPPNPQTGIGIAGAPPAIMHLEIRDKTARVTFADRDGMNAYKVWSVSFNQQGRVIAAGSENFSVYAAKAAPQMQPAPQPEVQPEAQPDQGKEQSPNVRQPSQSARQASTQPAETANEIKEPAPVEAKAQAPTSQLSTPPPAITASANEPPSEPGWKFIPHPPDPPSKIVPEGPAPPEKTMPEPSSPMDQPQQ